MFVLASSVDGMMVGKKYRKYWPTTLSNKKKIAVRDQLDVSIMYKYLCRWQFAYNAVLEDVNRRLNMWSWKHIKEHRSI